MLEQSSTNRILAHALRAGLLGWALSLAVLAQAGAAESVPPGVRACTAEADRERRLDCFDREVARFPDTKASAQAAKTQPAEATASAAAAGQATAKAAPTHATAATATAPAADAASTNSSSGASAASATRKADNPAKPGRITAQLISIDRAPNEMVLHLDNGQVWEEVQSVAGDLSLKAGDHVTIDKRLGSYWLTGPHVSGMKVRQKS